MIPKMKFNLSKPLSSRRKAAQPRVSPFAWHSPTGISDSDSNNVNVNVNTGSTPPSYIVEVDSVSKSYHHTRTGEVVVFDNYNLRVAMGEMLAVVGSSGAGKSTLMHMVGALESPTSGTISYKGRQLHTLNKGELAYLRSREVGFVFQSHFLLNELSAYENVMLPLMIKGQGSEESREQAYELLSTMGLAHREEHYPLELSGGEQQRVAIARAIANNPALLLADEPTGNLDADNSAKIMEIFHNLNSKGVTVIVVTHSGEVAKECTRTETLQRVLP